MKLKRLICFIAVVALAFGALAVPVFAEDYYTVDMSEYGFGFSLELPSSYTVYTAIDEPELMDSNYFFDAYYSESGSVPGLNLNLGWETPEPFITDIAAADEETQAAFARHIESVISANYGMNMSGISFETVEINGKDYLHAVFSAKGSIGVGFFDNYYANIGEDLIRFSALGMTSDGDTAYAAEAAELSLKMVNSVVISENPGSVAAAQKVTNDVASDKTDNFFEALTTTEFPLWFFVAALAVLLLSGVSVSKRGEWQEEPLSLDSSKGVQGFAAVAIILHHMSQGISNSKKDLGALSLFVDAGVLFVGIFFFFSGYGLLKSLRTKDNYLSGFFKKRLPTILVPFFACILVFLSSEWLLGGKFRIGELLGYLSGWFLINSHMWYIVEIAVLYVAFFLIFRFIKNEKLAFAAMGGFLLLLVTGSLLLGHGRFWFQGEWWFNATLLFFVGMLIARFELPLARFAKRFYALLLPICVAAFGFLFALNVKLIYEVSYYRDTASSFLCLGVQLPAIIFFVLSVLLIMLKVKFQNRALKFLGSIALELYLVHNLFIQYLRSNSVMNVRSDSMYILLVILFSVLLAAVLHGFDRYIIGLVTGKLHPSLSAEGDKKLHSIDLLRLLAIYFVIVIHLPFRASLPTGITIAFGKIAVPFFLVVCGYFLYREDTAQFMARLKKQALKIFILAVGSHLFYTLFAFLRSDMPFGEFIKTNFTGSNAVNLLLWNMSPFSDHLWYLGSLLYAILIIMLLCKTKVFKYAMFAAPLLLAGYIVLSFTQNPANYFMYRNALLCTLPYLMFGCLIRRYKDLLMNPSVWWYIVATVLLCITTLLEFSLHSGSVAMPYFSAELLVYAVILVALKLPSFAAGTLAERLGSRTTLFMYIFHMAIAQLILPLEGAPAAFVTLAPVVVFIASLLSAAVWDYLKSLVPKKQKTLAETSESKVL